MHLRKGWDFPRADAAGGIAVVCSHKGLTQVFDSVLTGGCARVHTAWLVQGDQHTEPPDRLRSATCTMPLFSLLSWSTTACAGGGCRAVLVSKVRALRAPWQRATQACRQRALHPLHPFRPGVLCVLTGPFGCPIFQSFTFCPGTSLISSEPLVFLHVCFIHSSALPRHAAPKRQGGNLRCCDAPPGRATWCNTFEHDSL